MADVREFVTGFISVIIGLVVGIALVPVITSTTSAANLTGASATMVALLPLLVVVGLLMFAVKSLF